MAERAPGGFESPSAGLGARQSHSGGQGEDQLAVLGGGDDHRAQSSWRLSGVSC